MTNHTITIVISLIAIALSVASIVINLRKK